MIDVMKLEISKITTLQKYKSMLEEANIHYLSDLVNLDLKELREALKIRFSECYELNVIINEITYRLENGTFSEIYSGDCMTDEPEKDAQSFYNVKDDIYSLDLSVRAYNCLRRASIYTVGDLLDYDILELKKIRNMGSKTYKEILSKINDIRKSDVSFDDKNVNIIISKGYVTIDDLSLSTRTYNALKSAGIDRIDSILNYSLFDFSKIKNMGSKSAKEAYAAIQSLKKSKSLEMIYDTFVEFKGLSDKIGEKLGNMIINDFDDLYLADFVEENNSLTFSQLHRIIIERFDSGIIGEDMLVIYNDIFSSYIKCSNLTELDIKIDERSFNILKDRFYNETYESLGNKYGITRERVRQIEIKAKNDVKKFFSSNRLMRFFKNNYYTNRNTTILTDSLYNALFYALDFLLDFDKKIVKESFYCIKKTFLDKIRSNVDDLYKRLSKTGIVFKNEVAFGECNYEIINCCLDEKNIKNNSNCFYLKGNDGDKILYYIKRFGIIDFSDSNINILAKELDEYLDIKDFDKHNLLCAIARRNVISLGDSKYCFLESMPPIDDDTFDKICKEIEEKKITDASYLLSIFKNEISDLYTPTSLYYAVKSKYSDVFNFGGANLGISIKSVPASKAQVIYRVLLEANEPVKNTDLISRFNIDKTALSVIDSQNDDIFYLDDVNLWLYSKMPDLSELLAEIKKYLESKQSFYVTDLFVYLKSKYKEKLEENYLTTFERFLKVLKEKMYTDLKAFQYDRFKKYYYRIQSKPRDEGFDLDF